MRKIEYFDTVTHHDDKGIPYREVDWNKPVGEGYFHQWSYGAQRTLFAVIELHDGTIIERLASKVRFCDSPE